MPEIRVDSEKDLIDELLQSKAYREFRNDQLEAKIDREKRTWDLIRENRGRYNRDNLNLIFDTVDLWGGKRRWFGAMLATPNQNLIFESRPEALNQWIEELLFSGRDPALTLNTCLNERKVKGASKGLATLLLYLSAPDKNNIWVNATQDGLAVLGRIGELSGNDWGRITLNSTKRPANSEPVRISAAGN